MTLARRTFPTENARLRKENDVLSDMVRAAGAPRGSRGGARFLTGVAVGLFVAYATLLAWSHEPFGARTSRCSDSYRHAVSARALRAALRKFVAHAARLKLDQDPNQQRARDDRIKKPDY